MTSRSKLSAITLICLVTLLSVVVYIQRPFQVVKEITGDNFRPRQRHLSDVAIPTLLPKLLHNGTTGDISEVAYRIAAPRPTEDFMVVNSEEQRKRKRTVVEACKHYGGKRTGDILNKLHGNLIVDDEHQVVYCSVPKIACTSWKKVFLVLNKSFKSTGEISQYYANREGQKRLTRLKDFPPSEINRILTTYTKFMFARHPFSRVLSAFRNKLAPDSTFERARAWQQSIGNRILEKYRQDNHPMDEYDLRFEEFVNYLADEDVPRAQSSNKHWSRVYDQCLPCDIDYDVIGKFETLQSDTEYVLKLIHAEHITFPGSNSSSPTGSSNQTQLETFYKNVPLVAIQGLYKRFEIDFDLFGYDPPTLAFKGS